MTFYTRKDIVIPGSSVVKGGTTIHGRAQSSTFTLVQRETPIVEDLDYVVTNDDYILYINEPAPNNVNITMPAPNASEEGREILIFCGPDVGYDTPDCIVTIKDSGGGTIYNGGIEGYEMPDKLIVLFYYGGTWYYYLSTSHDS